MFTMVELIFAFYKQLVGRAKALVFSVLFNKEFGFIGHNFKFVGSKYTTQKGTLRVGDSCWIEAVTRYRDQSFTPQLQFGKGVMISNNVHISCAHSIIIDDFVLIGSNVYIGDHSHGSLILGKIDITEPPFMRDLDDMSEIYIGKNTWISDGAVILAGAYICDGCVVGANSVVKGKFLTPSVIAGAPAKSVKSLTI